MNQSGLPQLAVTLLSTVSSSNGLNHCGGVLVDSDSDGVNQSCGVSQSWSLPQVSPALNLNGQGIIAFD
jgi:hypothetical protein